MDKQRVWFLAFYARLAVKMGFYVVWCMINLVVSIGLCSIYIFVGYRLKVYCYFVIIDVGLFSTGYLIGIVWLFNYIWMCEGDGWW